MDKRLILSGRAMRAAYDPQLGGFVSLTSPLDGHKADFLLTPEEFPQYDVTACEWLGNVDGEVEAGGARRVFRSGENRARAEVCQTPGALEVRWGMLADADGPLGFSLSARFEMRENSLLWHVTLENETDAPLVFTRLNLPLLMNQYFRGDDEFKYERVFMRHTCITGHSSYMYWEKSSGSGPVLLLAPLDETGFVRRRMEHENRLFSACYDLGVYEGLVRACVADRETPLEPLHAKPLTVRPHARKTLRFALVMLENEAQINQALERLGLTVLRAVPGMVGPADETFAIMTRPVGASVCPCDESDKVIASEVKKGWRVTRIRFGGYGRRWVRVTQENGAEAVYCFFATEPVGDMIRDHADFIVTHQRETDENDPCWHGFLMWDMTRTRRINAADNPYFDDWWRGGSDDPGLVPGLFLSEKNVYQPCEKEIDALNDYVEDFILARLTEQPGWRVHRMVPWYEMFEPWAGYGADDVWRAFNYVHVINTLVNMYRIQKLKKREKLREAGAYLKMAYEYTKAMFNYWMFPRGAGASEFGNMGEMTLPLQLPGLLMAEGFVQEATELSAIFDKKAHFFGGKAFPFGSEMPYDSTAFEAVYAYGRRIGSERVMRAAAEASYSNRGKQPVWNLYCTDLRGGGDSTWNSSYMTQLGAWPMLDYALHQGHADEDWLMACYGAYLSGWLLYNSGGYWDSAPENRGATGWITVSDRIDKTERGIHPRNGKLDMPLNKGLVAISGEACLGYFGALRIACSMVLEHSVLGRTGLGCAVEDTEGGERILPHDGLCQRCCHIAQRWQAETYGCRLRSLTTDGARLTVETENALTDAPALRVTTIPEPGEKERVLYEGQASCDGQAVVIALR